MTSTFTSIADQVSDFEAIAVHQLPADVWATFSAAQAALNAAGVPARVAAPGIQLPDVQLIDAQGASTSLHTVTGGRPVVIVFYRGVWCPYCNITLKAYQEQLLPELTKRGVGLVAISPQRPDGSLSMRQKNELTYPVVSDPGNVLAGELGILAPAPSAEVRAAQDKLGLDLTAVNADGADTLPMPTTALADAGNTIRWIDVHPNYATRTEVADILNALSSVL
ncbi:MAG: peroxiredoxin-like family protein [Pseudonocardiaceae bacterium]